MSFAAKILAVIEANVFEIKKEDMDFLKIIKEEEDKGSEDIPASVNIRIEGSALVGGGLVLNIKNPKQYVDLGVDVGFTKEAYEWYPGEAFESVVAFGNAIADAVGK